MTPATVVALAIAWIASVIWAVKVGADRGRLEADDEMYDRGHRAGTEYGRWLEERAYQARLMGALDAIDAGEDPGPIVDDAA